MLLIKILTLSKTILLAAIIDKISNKARIIIK